ncbi:MAG: methyltransferase family protein [Sphingomonadales bacterium]
MISIGNFFFKYRNYIFILFYAALFVPSLPLFSAASCGPQYYWWPVVLGLLITCMGQGIRGLTIGLAYIVRGGKEGKPYADGLVTEGIFRHCRNPLYVGNILMLLGVGILANSVFYVAVMMPLFLFIYQAIVLAEEDFLRKKFGSGFDNYCRDVNRWWPSLQGIGETLGSMEFNWKRWILKEHTTQFIWLLGICLLLFAPLPVLRYPELLAGCALPPHRIFAISLGWLCLAYLLIRVLKKTGRFTA